MNKEKYLAKIKKLLALGKSTNSHEAALALGRARKLMAEHNVSEFDVGISDISEASSQGAPSDAQAMPAYMVGLIQVIQKAFGVQSYASWRYTPRGIPKRIVTFYGPEERPQIAVYAWTVLSRQLVRARAEYVSGVRRSIKSETRIARADKFCEGWVAGVYEVVQKFAVTESEQTLMQAFITKYKSELKTATPRAAKQTRGGQGDAGNSGYLAGKNATLNQGLDGWSNYHTTWAIEG